MKSSGIQIETDICVVFLRKVVLDASRIQIVILLR